MAKTNAQRQAEYRARRLEGRQAVVSFERGQDRHSVPVAGQGVVSPGELGSKQLQVWLDFRAHQALKRVAKYRGVTLERLIESWATVADDEILGGLDDGDADLYLAQELRQE